MIVEQSFSVRKRENSSQTENEESLDSKKLEVLRQRINDENYLNAAIQRLALVMSNELMQLTKEGNRHEQWKRRK